jgi:type I restriction enzyme S subunit
VTISYYEKIGEKISEYNVDELPCGWSNASFSQVNMFISETVDPSNFPDEIFELYSVPNFEVGFPEITISKEIGSSKQSLRENDVLVCKINPRINRVWITGHITSYRLLGSSEWIVFRNHLLFAPYLRYYFSSPPFRELMLSNVSGVGGSLMRAQPESVKKSPILIPPYQEQIRIVERINKLFALLVAIEQSLN